MPGCALPDPCHRRGCPACYPERAGHVRLLWTASRDWDDPVRMWRYLAGCAQRAAELGKTLVIVHGDNGAGDMIGKLFGRLTGGCADEPWPADWAAPCTGRCKPGHRKRGKRGRDYCPAAGVYRNEEMVDSGVDACAAWIKDGSTGASGCARLAAAAGVSVQRFRSSSSLAG